MSTECSYKTYKRRWYVLAIVTSLNISNQHIWCSFSSVADIAAEYYSVSVSKINILSLVYFICCFPFGLFALWLADYIGLNKAVWIGAWFNAIGASIELISTTTIVPEDVRYSLTLVGQIFAGMGQMYLYVPTKVAELWFPPNEKTLASSLVAMSTPCGVMLGVGVTPLFVRKPDDIPILIHITSTCAIVLAIINCGFTSSRPPTPPSETAESYNQQAAFHKALKNLFTNKPYIFLLIFGGAMLGLSGTACTLLWEILRPRGYSNKFSGLCVVLMTSFGIIGGITSGVLVGKTKAFTPIAKITGTLSCILFIVYSVVIGFPGLEYVIAILSTITGVVVLMAYAVLLELTVECTYQMVPEATSTGILFTFGQLHGIMYFLILENFATMVNIEGVSVFDMKRSILIVDGIIVLFTVIFIIFFTTEYKRTNKELVSNLGNTNTESLPSIGEAASYTSSYGVI